jgi:hypothetical protein
MKFSQAALLTFLVTTSTSTSAFFVAPSLCPRKSLSPLAATVEKEKKASASASAATSPPVREAPGAGYVPAWENRPGLSQEEFLNSDMSKPDLSAMWECPLTRWDYKE